MPLIDQIDGVGMTISRCDAILSNIFTASMISKIAFVFYFGYGLHDDGSLVSSSFPLDWCRSSGFHLA
jgi:hypothetical protein